MNMTDQEKEAIRRTLNREYQTMYGHKLKSRKIQENVRKFIEDAIERESKSREQETPKLEEAPAITQ